MATAMAAASAERPRPGRPVCGLAILVLLGLVLAGGAGAVELDDAYRFLGPYGVTASGGIRLYYPAGCQAIIPHVLDSFIAVRTRLLEHFPDQRGFEVTVLLTDHDDRETGSVDATFDLVSLGLYEEMGSLSTRGYSLEDRFALRLAYTLIMRTLGSARIALRRRIGLLSIPPWFFEGLALSYAFPLDVLQTTRLLDLARRNCLYNIDDLDTIQSRRVREREEMSFQVHSMIDFWHGQSMPDAGLRLLRQVRTRPGQFSEQFQRAFGFSLNEGFRRYREHVRQECARHPDCAGGSGPEVIRGWGEGEFAQGARPLPDGRMAWVSSRRYTEEVYDLWRQAPGKKAVLTARNVHPGLWVDPDTGSIFLGRFELTARRQRRLFLWEIPAHGRARRVVDLPGSFQPLGWLDGRLFFLNWTEGTLRVLSVGRETLSRRDGGTNGPQEVSPRRKEPQADGDTPTESKPEALPDRKDRLGREEYCFPAHLRPLSVALDPAGRRLLFVVREGRTSFLCRDRLHTEPALCPEVLHACPGTIRALWPAGEAVYFATDADFRTLQVFRWNPAPSDGAAAAPQEAAPPPPPAGGTAPVTAPTGTPDPGDTASPTLLASTEGSGTPTAPIAPPAAPAPPAQAALAAASPTGVLQKLTAVPGGVWDFCLEPAGWILGTTFQQSRFWPIRLPTPVLETTPARTDAFACCPPAPGRLKFRPYRQEFRSSYWLPRVTRDDQGAVLGVYSYRADRLDRSRIVVSPTYGFKSRDLGYAAEIMRRFDLWQVSLNAQDRVVRKSYRDQSYYERDRGFDLGLSFPFSLATSFTVGGNFTHRGIAELPDQGGPVPSVGRDHSLYGVLAHRAIRTEPFWELLPRKGRRITASYRKGLDLFGGELKYDSFAVRYEEYRPIGGPWVLAFRGYVAEDDKEGDIRRPDDLNLGGTDFLRGYPGSVRFGDSLRAFSLHLSRPFRLTIPALHRWVQEEFLVAEAFWERGDVRSSGRRFSFLEDRGLELRARGLLLRRIPVTIRWGAGWPSDGGPRHSYWMVDISSVSGMIQ
ncbi:MAG: hypothetical protein GX442_17310 [Candidatus Riflebacteria bacterium]|nr:hypothetical protein [Candidatus Riflebacteria bacterium]